MSFTILLVIMYFILFVVEIFAFIKGKKKQKWISFIVNTIVIITSILLLGYLWITSPM